MNRIWKCFALCLIALLALCHAACAECNHWVLCEDPTVCVECGAQGVSVPESEVVHEWLFTDLGDMHKLYCLY
jgi:hypothetical protein